MLEQHQKPTGSFRESTRGTCIPVDCRGHYLTLVGSWVGEINQQRTEKGLKPTEQFERRWPWRTEESMKRLRARAMGDAGPENAVEAGLFLKRLHWYQDRMG